MNVLLLCISLESGRPISTKLNGVDPDSSHGSHRIKPIRNVETDLEYTARRS